jgi:hypothetical protein
VRVHYATCGSDAEPRIRELAEQAHEPVLLGRSAIEQLGAITVCVHAMDGEAT